MITTKQIIICKELIDIVDDILHYNLFDKETSTICDNDPKHKGIINVFNSIVDAHNAMLGVYCNLISNENEEFSCKVLNKVIDALIEVKKEGVAQ